MSAYSREQTHCLHGHEFSEENTRWARRRSRTPGGPDRWQRVCRPCARRTRREHEERERIMRIYAEVLASG